MSEGTPSPTDVVKVTASLARRSPGLGRVLGVSARHLLERQAEQPPTDQTQQWGKGDRPTHRPSLPHRSILAGTQSRTRPPLRGADSPRWERMAETRQRVPSPSAPPVESRLPLSGLSLRPECSEVPVEVSVNDLYHDIACSGGTRRPGTIRPPIRPRRTRSDRRPPRPPTFSSRPARPLG
jgi:hypothetical protein